MSASLPAPSAGHKPFYGWVVAGLSWLNQGLGYTVWYSFSVFLVTLLNEFSWERGSTAAVFSVCILVGALAGPAVGALVDRIGARLVIPFGAVLTAVGLAICARIDEPWQFYLAFGLLAGLGVTGIGMVPNNAAVSRWFVRRLGLAAGAASTGVGFGIFVLVPQIQALIEQYGWRTAYLVMGAVLIAVLLPLNLLLQRGRPEDLGLEPDGGVAAPDEHHHTIVDALWASRLWTLRSAAATSRFWLLFGGLGAATFAQQLLLVHQVAFLVDAGRPLASAAKVAAIYGLFAVPAKVILGAACDRVGREVTFAGGTLAYIVAFPVLVAAGNSQAEAPLWGYALLVGVGLATIGPIAPGMVADIFSGPSFGTIFGAVLVSTGIGGALGAWFGGWTYDHTGSYFLAFSIAIVAAGSAIVSLWAASPRKVRRIDRG